MKSWQQALDILEFYQLCSDMISKVVAALHVLYDEVPIRYSQHMQQTGPGGEDTALNLTPRSLNGTAAVPFDFSNYDNRAGQAAELRHNEDVLNPFTVEADFLDPVAFDFGDLFWLNTVPADFLVD